MLRKRLFELFCLVFVSLSISSCSRILSDRTFIKEMEAGENEVFVPHRTFRVVPGDTGRVRMSRSEMRERTPAGAKDAAWDAHEIALNDELKDLEASLSNEEYDRYLEYADSLESTSEKIYFLRLRTRAEREEYLYSKGLYRFSRIDNREIKAAISGRDIVVGMGKEDVLQSWGRPARVDVAGDPRYENERWTFYTGGRVRQVYFENGNVQGWEIDE